MGGPKQKTKKNLVTQSHELLVRLYKSYIAHNIIEVFEFHLLQ